MIMTECCYCDRPLMVSLSQSLIGCYLPHDCPGCDETVVVEMTRIDGTTYPMDEFEQDVLPDLDGIERIDHSSGEMHIYGDPDSVHEKPK